MQLKESTSIYKKLIFILRLKFCEIEWNNPTPTQKIFIDSMTTNDGVLILNFETQYFCSRQISQRRYGSTIILQESSSANNEEVFFFFAFILSIKPREKFSWCPHCGLVVITINKSMRIVVVTTYATTTIAVMKIDENTTVAVLTNDESMGYILTIQPLYTHKQLRTGALISNGQTKFILLN